MQFVIDSKKSAMDEHWKPTSYYCSMCMLNYDYVIKFEDLSIESQAFLEVSKLKKKYFLIYFLKFTVIFFFFNFFR